MLRLSVLLAVVLALSSAPAVASEAFQSPSRNIGCVWEGGRLRCDIGEHHWTGIPAKPSWCHFDWALGFWIGPDSRVTWVCGSDTVLHIGPVLKYGATWHRHHLMCTMRRSGLTCRNRARHGFFMSRSSWRRW